VLGECPLSGSGAPDWRCTIATEPEPSKRRTGDPYVVSVTEAAELLGISKDLAYDLARRGELPGAIHLGRRWRVSLVRLTQALHGPQDGAVE
jgi:excisionase family DNA binding protein